MTLRSAGGDTPCKLPWSGFTMIVGANAAAIILEVGYVEGDMAVVIIHAMRARKRFLQ